MSATFGGDTSNLTSATITFSEAMQTTSVTSSSVRLLSPSGQSIPLTSIVAGNGNSSFTLNFARQTTAGTYTLIVEPTVADAAGNRLNQDGDGTFGETTQDRFTATRAIAPVTTTTFTSTAQVALRDQATTTVSLVVSSNLTIDDIDFKVNLRHTYDSDLVITAIHPDGTRVLLFNRRGGAGDNLTNTTFSDEAATAIANGVAPFSGTFRPEAALSAFDGKSTSGTWRLEIRDAAAADTGTLLGVSLVVTGRAATTSGVRGFESGPVASFAAQQSSSSTESPVAIPGTNGVASLIQTGMRIVSSNPVAPAANLDQPQDRRTNGSATPRDLDYLFSALGTALDQAWDTVTA